MNSLNFGSDWLGLWVKVRSRNLGLVLRYSVLLAGNDTVPISMCRGGGMHSIVYPLVVTVARLSLLRHNQANDKLAS